MVTWITRGRSHFGLVLAATAVLVGWLSMQGSQPVAAEGLAQDATPTAAAIIGQPQFDAMALKEIVPFGAETQVTDLAVGDLDGNGQLDIVLATADFATSTTCRPADPTGEGASETVFVPPTPDPDTDSIIIAAETALVQSQLTILFNESGSDAQTPWREVVVLPLLGSVVCGVALGDLNADGMLDIATAVENGPNLLLLNGSGGDFSATVTFGSSDDATLALALGDVDSNGTLDVVTGSRCDTTACSGGRVYTSLTVTEPLILLESEPPPDAPTSTPTVTVAVEASAGVLLTEWDTLLPGDSVTSVALGNIDGRDGLDMVLGRDRAASVLLLGSGTGVEWETQVLDTAVGTTRAVRLGDINQDGRLDLLEIGGATVSEALRKDVESLLAQAQEAELTDDQGRDRVYFNQSGTAGATAVFGSSAMLDLGEQVATGSGERTETLFMETAVLADINGDSQLDIVGGGGFFAFPRQTYVLLNEGGTFTRRSTFAVGPQSVTTAVAVADLNNDGTLDIVGGTNAETSSAIFFRAADSQTLFAAGAGNDTELRVSSVVVGDVVGDEKLDMVVGDGRGGGIGNRTLILENKGGDTYEPRLLNATDPGLNANNSSQRRSFALADLNQDGFLDIIEGNYGQNVIYFTAGAKGSFLTPVPLGDGTDITRSIAVGNLNDNNALDIVVGNLGQNAIYLDVTNVTSAANPAVVFGEPERTHVVALGDLDQDGLQDIVVGNGSGSLFNVSVDGDGARQVSSRSRRSQSQSRIFYNTGIWTAVDDSSRADDALEGVMFQSLADTQALQLADFNGDSLLDIVTGNGSGGDKDYIYFNSGDRSAFAPMAVGGNQRTRALAAADYDGDGDTDLAVTSSSRTQLYLNDGRGALEEARSLAVGTFGLRQALAAGDLDADGLPDLVLGQASYSTRSRSGAVTPFYGRLRHTTAVDTPNPALPNDPPRVHLGYPQNDPTAVLPYHFSNRIFDAGQVDIPFTLTDGESDPVGQLRAYYSLDGGGSWTAVRGQLLDAAQTEVTGLLPASPDGTPYTLRWDVVNSGVFGATDSAVVRLVALPAAQVGGVPAGEPQPGRVPQATHWPLVSATTALLRVEGLQVRVGGADDVSEAVVYRLPAGQISGAFAMSDQQGNPFHPDGAGMLTGRGIVNPGDTLYALLPVDTADTIPFTDRLTLLHTSATPNPEGLTGLVVDETTTGDIELTVDDQRPLLVFHLVVSLEWDARSDSEFLLGLENAFQRASEVLYDVSDGQVALGHVQVYHDKTFWHEADITIAATNALRPSAAYGGIVQEPTLLRDSAGNQVPSDDFAYKPGGQIRMGTAFDPFGITVSDLGDQWAVTLAHELAHYLLFLPDNYIGYVDPEQQRDLIRVDCKGSFMTSTFDPDYTELLGERGWETVLDENGRAIRDENGVTVPNACPQTLAQEEIQSWDRSTVMQFYEMLQLDGAPLAGPAVMPLDLLTITQWLPYELDGSSQPARTPLLPERIFLLRDAETRERIRLEGARVYLFQQQGTADPSDDMVIWLGTPVGGGDRINVRGARAGDQLCAFYTGETPRSGCVEALSATDAALPVRTIETEWQPAVAVTPVAGGDNQTLQIEVEQALAEGETLLAQIFPMHYGSSPGTVGLSPVVELTATDDGLHSGQVTLLAPAFDVIARVWVAGDNGRQSLSQFLLPWIGPECTAVADADAACSYVNRFSPYGAFAPAADTPDQTNNSVTTRGLYVWGGPQAVPIGGPQAVPIGGPQAVPIGGPQAVPIGGPQAVPIGGPQAVPIGGPQAVPIGGASQVSLFAPVASADAQFAIYSNNGFFEDNGVESIQILGAVPDMADHRWLLPIGQAYQVMLADDSATDNPRSISFSYGQRDLPAGYEHTLNVYFLPEDATAVTNECIDANSARWRKLPTNQYPDNLLIAELAQDENGRYQNGTYAIMATVELANLKTGYNLVTYSLPDTRPLATALASLCENRIEDGPFESSLETIRSLRNRLDENVRLLIPQANLNVRAAPGSSAPVVNFVRTGELLEIRDFREGLRGEPGWYEIVCPKQTIAEQCWVTGNPLFTEIREPETPEELLEALAQQDREGVESNVAALSPNTSYWLRVSEDVDLLVRPPVTDENGVFPGLEERTIVPDS